MAKVRALKNCITDNCYREAGQVFEYDGEVNPSVLMLLADEDETPKPKRSKKAVKAANIEHPPEPADGE